MMEKKTKIKLEVGKSYKNQYGDIEHIVAYVGGLRPFEGRSGHMYAEDGEYDIFSSSGLDLIEEVDTMEKTNTTDDTTTTTTDPKGVYKVKYLAAKNSEVSELEDSLRKYICGLVTMGKYQDARMLLNILV